jgi:acetolactate synthase I/II/III large subunit
METQKIKLRGADYIVKLLECLGADNLFAYPGGAILPIYDALAFSKVKNILVRHEQGGALAANGYARVTGKPGFCLSTSGPGATNMVTGIADAYADSIPMIAITGQVAGQLIGSDAFQETDITGICIPITKRTYIARHLSEVPGILQDAYRTAISGRPGPVLVDIPRDVQVATIELDADWEQHYTIPERERCYNTNDMELAQAAQLIAEAKKPLVIAGHGILLSEAWEELRAFVKREHLPVISTILGIGVMKNNDPLYFSWLGMHGTKYANDAVQNADLLIALGIRFDDRITGKLDKFAPNAKVVHVDIDKSENSKNVRASVFLNADVKRVLQELPDTRSTQNQRNRRQWVESLDQQRAKYPFKEANHDVFNMITALDVLNEVMDEDAIVTTDVGQHQMWAAQYVNRINPNRFLTSAGLGTMGFGLPAAMGAQAAAPGNQVWCISGDGSIQMNIQELMTCVQENYPIRILILDNNYLGMVRQWQEQFWAGNYSGVNLMNPDFVMLAKAFGIEGVCVTTVEEYKEALHKASDAKGPFLIHARVVKEDNVLPMIAPGTTLSDTIYYPEGEELYAKQKTQLITR